MVAAKTAAAAATTPLLSNHDDSSTLETGSRPASITSIEYKPDRRTRQILLGFSFATALLACLCAGSIQTFSLFGHLFQERLNYTQLQVNYVSIGSGIAMYITVPPFGFLCDRIGPRILSQASALLYGFGFLLAAFTYRSGATKTGELPKDGRWPVWVMVLAFACIGSGTTALYLPAIASNAKNFGKGRFKGIALAVPIAGIGLGGMLLSQIGSKVLYETTPDGRRGDVDVFKFFIFLAILLFVVGSIGAIGLKVIDEDELIDDAVEELERSGLLEDSDYFRRSNERGYGTTQHGRGEDAGDEEDNEIHLTSEEEEALKKTNLLNEETRQFLRDPTMWWLTAGFCLIIGPGEAFLNNMGTIIGTLQPPTADAMTTSAATHISIMAIGSTVSRLVAGTVTDILAPATTGHHFRGSAANSISSLPPQNERFSISRVSFLISVSLLMSFAEVFLASGLAQNHGERFWIVSLLMGCSYGAIFSLTPILVTVVWGVENFGTNWGIICMAPVVGGTFWSLIYSTVYQWAAAQSPYRDTGGSEDTRCYGKECYSGTFWAMAISAWVACGMILWAWKGKGGWSRRGIAV